MLSQGCPLHALDTLSTQLYHGLSPILTQERIVSEHQYPSYLGTESIPAGKDDPTNTEIAWRPTPQYLERSRLRSFMARHDFGAFEDLLNKAAGSPEWFWGAAVEDLGI